MGFDKTWKRRQSSKWAKLHVLCGDHVADTMLKVVWCATQNWFASFSGGSWVICLLWCFEFSSFAFVNSDYLCLFLFRCLLFVLHFSGLYNVTESSKSLSYNWRVHCSRWAEMPSWIWLGLCLGIYLIYYLYA